jgi:uncharacterized phage infection (PIP) family protein YhgE
MRILFVAFIIVAAITAFADDLEDLKATSVRYVAAMKAALAISDSSDCSETIANANDYAAAKIAYYKTARQAMPALLQMAKGPETNSHYGNELLEIFRGFGEDTDEAATGALEAKLKLCQNSEQSDQAHLPLNKQRKSQRNSLRTLEDSIALEGATGILINAARVPPCNAMIQDLYRITACLPDSDRKLL